MDPTGALIQGAQDLCVLVPFPITVTSLNAFALLLGQRQKCVPR